MNYLPIFQVSLLLGTIIRKIPLPIDSCSGSLKPNLPISNAANALMPRMSNVVLDLRQLGQVGNHFLEVLLKMKHNGAIDKTRAGFTALCNRLLCSNDPRLCKLTESWMEQLMERTGAKGQTVDNLLRRSAGIPAAFIALFLSEPEGAPKKLLPLALRWLIDVAKSSLLGSSDVKSTTVDSCKFSLTNSEHELDCINHFESKVLENSKNRDEGVVPTVHAFNVLRTAFDDTNLATDTSGFAAEALIVSIRSFSSPYWEIRNSACLAYSALVRRMMGFLNVQKRESAKHALTGLEFFHRYPSLHPFIYDELKIATELLRGATSGNSESNLAKVVHPSLCPILILLSRLKPSTVAIESGDDLDPFLFMPFIRSCSTQSNLRVRILASRALTGLVSNEKLSTVLLNIASELPCLDNHTSASPTSYVKLDLIDEAHQASYNSIHGMLLQLSSLLDANCRNLADFAKKGKIIGDLIQVLRKRSWIASPQQCPCPMLNASFLSVLDHMLSIARKGHLSENFYVICDLLLELSAECLDIKDCYGLSYFDPTIAELRKQAAISYFSCVLQASEEETEEAIRMPQTFLSPGLDMLKEAKRKNVCAGLQDRLLHSLSDSSYEVRLATLKWLLKLIKSRNFSNEVNHQFSSEIRIVQQWTKSNLQPTMMKLLDSEKYHRCTHYILRIIFGWNLLQFQVLSNKVSVDTSFVGNLDHVSVTWFWDKLMSLYESTRHAKTQEALICCMAICVKQYGILLTSHVLTYTEKETSRSSELHDLDRFSDLYGRIAFYVNLIKEHSSPSEPVDIRKAAAESIVASGLLELAELAGTCVSTHDIPSEIASTYSRSKDPVSMYAHQVLEVWFTCIKLLEDEDDEIRQKLAVDVQKCFSSGTSKHDCDSAGVPTQVEKVIELSFAHLSSTLGHWIYYFEYLLQWVRNAANYVVSKGDLVRRVFDKEIDNHHEEKLLLCQLCCYHTEKLPVSRSCFDKPSRAEFRNYLYRWRREFCNQLMSFAKDHMEILREADWIGGVGNHKDAFLPLYANLLGFYALTNCIFNLEIDDGTRLLFDVIELGRTINPFLKNPLICNLYFLVVKSHEKMFGATSDQLICPPIDGLLWDGFDPYFLLR
uniref:Uncharacterized protein MANES_15G175000 n=1 Tax=Rhizophora mucronata TaxID=61149 RepID=A0A2P2JCS0_RHIMU